MRFVVHLLAAIVIALVVGFGLSWWALTDGRLFGVVDIGPWSTWSQAGAPAPDPYARAHVSRTGALQLGASEGLQFIAITDSEGRRLDRDCRYRIDGETPVATFWTLVPTTLEGAPIARPGGPMAFHSARLARAADGAPRLYVGKALSPYNWLEITGEGPFALALTLYDTSSVNGGGPAVASLPAIIREGCA